MRFGEVLKNIYKCINPSVLILQNSNQENQINQFELCLNFIVSLDLRHIYFFYFVTTS